VAAAAASGGRRGGAIGWKARRAAAVGRALVVPAEQRSGLPTQHGGEDAESRAQRRRTGIRPRGSPTRAWRTGPDKCGDGSLAAAVAGAAAADGRRPPR